MVGENEWWVPNDAAGAGDQPVQARQPAPTVPPGPLPTHAPPATYADPTPPVPYAAPGPPGSPGAPGPFATPSAPPQPSLPRPRRRRSPILIIIGVILLAAGLGIAAVFLTQKAGPGGLCGSLADNPHFDFAPCKDDLQSSAILAGAAGGSVVLIGLVLVVGGVVGRRPVVVSDLR